MLLGWQKTVRQEAVDAAFYNAGAESGRLRKARCVLECAQSSGAFRCAEKEQRFDLQVTVEKRWRATRTPKRWREMRWPTKKEERFGVQAALGRFSPPPSVKPALILLILIVELCIYAPTKGPRILMET